MKKKSLCTCTVLSVIFFASLPLFAAADSDSKAVIFTRQEVREFFRMQHILYPDQGDKFRKLEETFGESETYTSDQLTAITKPTVSKPKDYTKKPVDRALPARVDAMMPDAIRRHFAIIERRNPSAGDLWNALVVKYGRQPWYLAKEVRDVEENGVEKKQIDQPRGPDDPVGRVLIKAEVRRRTFFEGFKSPRIRQSWRDVLYDEDQSQDANKGKALGDLVGATLSYSHDGKANNDTWSAIGSVIVPWVHDFPVYGGFVPDRVALAPSISVNRVDGKEDKTGQSDSVLYRLGGYSDWVASGKTIAGLQLRGAAVYATDTSHRASLPGYEFDIEPRIQGNPAALGFKRILIHKAPLKDDLSDQSLLDYQVRAWLHVEGGTVQDAGDTWNPATGSFCRVGPTLQLQIRAPRLMFGRELSLTALFSHLKAVSGPNDHGTLIKASAVYNLFKNEELNHKVAITADYQKGGLNFTEEQVDTLTIGLGILF